MTEIWILFVKSTFSQKQSVLVEHTLVGRAIYLSIYLSMYLLSIYLSIYRSICLSVCLSISLSPSDFLSTVIISALCNCLVEKVNHGTDVFNHKHTELPASSYICSQAHMYEIYYTDRQYKQSQDKSS